MSPDREALTKWHNELFSETMKALSAAYMERHKAREPADHPRFQIVYSSALMQLAATLMIDGGVGEEQFKSIVMEAFERAYAAAPKFA